MIRKFAAGLLCAALMSGPAAAELVAMASDLSAQAEVPPNPSPARGRADVMLDTASKTLSWTIHFSGLSAPLSAAHFHGPATTTANAGILVPISGAGGQSPLTGSASVNDQQVADILAGRWYINLHTPNYPGGEIRGQVVRK